MTTSELSHKANGQVTPISVASKPAVTPAANDAPVSIGKPATATPMLPAVIPGNVSVIHVEAGKNGGGSGGAPALPASVPALELLARPATDPNAPCSIIPIVPFMSCKCFPEDLQKALDQGYNEVYVFTLKGIVKHHKLRGQNRFVRLQAKVMPPSYKEIAVEQAMNFLPAGKVPYALYEQVESFFRQVIKLKGAALEAMIFVMYNKDRGYFLHVPPQTVTGGSVNYTTEGFPSESSIIINIHSHGHMSAFFSSIDDNNDKTMVQFSGVLGRFQDARVETKWRFNYYDQHRIEVKLDDMFESKEVEIPADWVNQVDRPTASTVYSGSHNSYHYGGQHHGAQGGYNGNRGSDTSAYQYPRTGSLHVQGGSSNKGNVQTTTVDELKKRQESGGQQSRILLPTSSERYQYQQGATSTPSQASGTGTGKVKTRADVEREIATSDLFPEFHGHQPDSELDIQAWWQRAVEEEYGSHEQGNDSVSLPKHLPAQQQGHYSGTQRTSSTSEFNGWEYDPIGNRMVKKDSTGRIVDHTPAPEDMLGRQVPDEEGGPSLGKFGGAREMLPGFTDATYESYAATYGVEIADAWFGIDHDMFLLESKDELLEGLIKDMFELFSKGEAQAQVFRELFERLPSREREKIEQQGL